MLTNKELQQHVLETTIYIINKQNILGEMEWLAHEWYITKDTISKKKLSNKWGELGI